MTAITRWAEAPTAASIITSSSIIASLAVIPVSGLEHVGWTMNTSAPRIDSSYRQYTSPAENVFSVTWPSSIPSLAAIWLARSGLARPEKTIIRFPVTIGTLPDTDLAVPAPMARAVYRRATATNRSQSLPVLELGFALPDSITGVIGAIWRIWLSADSRVRA